MEAGLYAQALSGYSTVDSFSRGEFWASFSKISGY